MTPREFVEPGIAEPLKAACHASAAAICLTFAAYNGAAYTCREDRDWRSLLNCLVYLGALGWEIRKTCRHL